MSKLEDLLSKYGMLFSEELGIDVSRKPFQWLLASVLFGMRINTTIAKNTFLAYKRNGLTTPEAILNAGWYKLVRVHGEGGYVRYDGMTADYMLDIAKKLLDDYDGNVRKLDELSKSPKELEERLLEFRGIGPVTVSIFLRELRGIWKNADPLPTNVEIIAARKLGITKAKTREKALDAMKRFWKKNKIKGYDFRNFEAMLVRIGLKLRRTLRAP
ncbi:MAG: hypothetical protein J7K68_06290 [Candidatus Diapherotrites archaeon]|nr:hypothetical protein [Candidatus Diapherotrites archaeon]